MTNLCWSRQHDNKNQALTNFWSSFFNEGTFFSVMCTFPNHSSHGALTLRTGATGSSPQWFQLCFLQQMIICPPSSVEHKQHSERLLLTVTPLMHLMVFLRDITC